MTTPAFADTDPPQAVEESLPTFTTRIAELWAQENDPRRVDDAVERYRDAGSGTKAVPSDASEDAGTGALTVTSPMFVVWSASPPDSSEAHEEFRLAPEERDSRSEWLRTERAELQERLTYRFGHEISARRDDARERADAAAAALDSPSSGDDGDATNHATGHAGRAGHEASVPGPDLHDPEVKPAFSTGGEECVGGDVSQYPNGEIPESALCPLPQPGHTLRADAAAAFMGLDEAYQAHFGYPICVTDAYRPLSEQERLFEEKEAGMAAQPGTSQHGLGVAVDLCGGVQEHGSVQYEWLMDNAGEHGWHNPPWAQDGFEPWHWEYQD